MGLISKLFRRKVAGKSDSLEVPIQEQVRQFMDGVDLMVKDFPANTRAFEALKLTIFIGVHQCWEVSVKYIKATDDKDRQLKEFTIRCEFLYFFLHLVNRRLYTDHGEAIGKRWQSEVGPRLIVDFLESTIGHWPKEMKDRIRGEMYDKVNDSEREFSVCRGLYPEDKKIFTGNTLFSTLARHIAGLAETTNPAEQFLIMDGTCHVFLRIGFQERINQVAMQLAS
jgi:hypothetical protein